MPGEQVLSRSPIAGYHPSCKAWTPETELARLTLASRADCIAAAGSCSPPIIPPPAGLLSKKPRGSMPTERASSPPGGHGGGHAAAAKLPAELQQQGASSASDTVKIYRQVQGHGEVFGTQSTDYKEHNREQEAKHQNLRHDAQRSLPARPLLQVAAATVVRIWNMS